MSNVVITDVHLDLARRQIEFARGYTLSLLDDIEDDAWFKQPATAPTNIAWQVGHLAMAEYGLCLYRQRGRESTDRNLMPSKFRKQFSRGSTPLVDTTEYPSVMSIRAAMRQIHQQSVSEMAAFTVEQLAESIERPFAVYANKLGALLFCSQHEMLHAGQIGLIRRLLGKEPVR